MSAESLIESLERLRWQLCDYVDQPTCDCKYGASGRGEQTGCPELRDAIYTLRGLRAERDEARAALQRIRDATGRLSDIAETLLYDGDRDQPCAGYVEVYGVIDWLGAIAAAEPGGRLTCSVCGALPLGIHNEEMHAAAEPGEQGGEQ